MASIQQRMPEEKPLLTPESRLPGNMPHPLSLEPENLEARETGAGEPGTPDRLTSEEPRRARPPQCIAHRGYAAKYPENTIAAFRGAADAGADALETDLHLSRDGVVVLSHVCLPSPSPASHPVRISPEYPVSSGCHTSPSRNYRPSGERDLTLPCTRTPALSAASASTSS